VLAVAGEMMVAAMMVVAMSGEIVVIVEFHFAPGHG
jgi:hypothetical protein